MKYLLLSFLITLTVSANTGVGEPHSETSGAGTTDIMGYGTPGGGGMNDELYHDEDAKMNSQQRMEENRNNSSLILESDRKTKSDGQGTTRKDTRPQGNDFNRDSSDFAVDEK